MRTNGRLPWSFMLCLMLTLLLSTEAAVAQGLGVGASIDVENISCIGTLSNSNGDDDDDDNGQDQQGIFGFPPPPPTTTNSEHDGGDDDGNGIGGCTYAAKFLCGDIPAQVNDPENPLDAPVEVEQLAPGSYRTAVNIYNPSDGGIDVAFKLAIDGGGPAIGTFTEVDMMSAEQLDCLDIQMLVTGAATRFDAAVELLVPGSFIKGFVVLEPEVNLAVTAIYTFKNVDFEPAGPGTE